MAFDVKEGEIGYVMFISKELREIDFMNQRKKLVYQQEVELDQMESEDKMSEGESQREFSWMKNQNKTKDIIKYYKSF